MRKFLIPAAVIAATLATAAPAAAQWAPQGNAYGYNNNYGQVRRLEVRVMQLRRQIQQLDRRNILSNNEARRLDAQARNLEIRVRQLGRNGLNSRERYTIERQIAQLEQRIRNQANDGNRRYGNNNNYYGNDRDRDDRYNDGRRRDRDDDRRRDRDDDDDDD